MAGKKRRKSSIIPSNWTSIVLVLLALAILYFLLQQRNQVTQPRIPLLNSPNTDSSNLPVPVGKQYNNKETWDWSWNPDKSLKRLVIERNATES